MLWASSIDWTTPVFLMGVQNNGLAHRLLDRELQVPNYGFLRGRGTGVLE